MARANLAMMEPIKMTMVAAEYSGVSAGAVNFSIASMTICTPAAIMMRAMMMVVVRSILARLAFWRLASFSPMTTRKPETASMREWAASDVMASELASNPTMRLKTASKKFVRMNK